jgi:hypothetical protein
MKLLLLSSSSSRLAGGLYNSVRNLGQELLKKENIAPVFFGFRDEYTDVDVDKFKPLPVVLYNAYGSTRVTFDLFFKMRRDSPDIIHSQGIYLFSWYTVYYFTTGDVG